MGEVAMRNNISFGDGVYKSTDAGKTWKHMGLKNSWAIGKIAVDPQNPDKVFVSLWGKFLVPAAKRAYTAPIDGGQNWQRLLYVDDSTGCVDVKMDPTNSLILYASMWQAHIHPIILAVVEREAAYTKSTDGGDTWKLISRNPVCQSA